MMTATATAARIRRELSDRIESPEQEPHFRSSRGSWLEVGAVCAIALVTRLIHLDHTPMTDELYHALAARSLLTDGTLDLPGGAPYERARLFTYATAGMFRLFGVSLEVARIIPLLAGVALITGFFLWLRSHAGRAAAWTTALVVGFAPTSLYLSQMARFYTVHALCYFIAAVCVFRMTTPGPMPLRERSALAAGAAAALLLALHLQVTTIVGSLALGGWIVGLYGRPALGWCVTNRRRLPLLAAAALLLAAGVYALAVTGLLQRLWAEFRWADLWALDRRDSVRHYYDMMNTQYAPLWGLFPFAAVLALVRHPRLAAYCLTIFCIAFVVHSFGGFKHERYLFYALPFFMAVVGMAFGALLPALWRWTGIAVAATLRLRGRPATIMAALVFASGLLFFINTNQAATHARHMLMRSDAEWVLPRRYRGEPDWQAAARLLRERIASSDVVIASSEAAPLYYLDRLDYLLRPVAAGVSMTVVADFALDPKSGRAVITRPESVQLLMTCFHTGLLLLEDKEWGIPSGVPDATARFIDAHMERLAVPASLRIRVYRWTTPSAAPEACSRRAAAAANAEVRWLP